jgi:hypothetical protein
MMRKTLLSGVLTAGLMTGFAGNARAQEAMLIYGGEDNRTFLGCLNCDKNTANSVQNEYGQYGSQYSSTSIFNKYGQYGSPYSQYSVCNEYTTTAPVIVDKNGKFYGRLSLNSYAPNEVQNASIRTWLAGVCRS